MALPILTVSKHELILPSSGEKISFRPFLVKEEKILMTAMQSGDPADMVGARQLVWFGAQSATGRAHYVKDGSLAHRLSEWIRYGSKTAVTVENLGLFRYRHLEAIPIAIRVSDAPYMERIAKVFAPAAALQVAHLKRDAKE